MGKGKVYLTGGGCGDAKLLTLRALEVLRGCDAVVYDSLAPEGVLEWCRPECERIYVGKRCGSHAMRQAEINALLVELARQGKTVVRLKGGDPYVFGRGGEEFLAVTEAGIYCEEIPGISSAFAVPAAAGIPVTHRGLAAGVTVVTGTAAQEEGQARLKLDFDTLARLEGTLVILMGMHHLREIAAGLMDAGKDPDTPCAVIMEGTTGRQRCVRAALSRIGEEALRQGVTSPAVIVIGVVAKLELLCPGEDSQPEAGQSCESGIGKEAGQSCWSGIGKEAGQSGFSGTEREAGQSGFSGNGKEAGQSGFSGAGRKCGQIGADKPGGSLSGVSVGVTGTAHFTGKLSLLLGERGADVWDMGFMEVRPNENPLPDLGDFSWLVFTSPNGVRVFLDKMGQERRDLRLLCGKRIAVIGPGTAAALEENGIYADYMPGSYDAAHLARGLAEKILTERQEGRGGKIPAVFLRAGQGSAALPRIFDEKGIPFLEYPLYELRVQEERRAALAAGEPDYLVFGSAMGVRAYFEGLGQAGFTNEKSRFVCIGELCAEELGKHTKRQCLIAREPGVEAIVDCICINTGMPDSRGQRAR